VQHAQKDVEQNLAFEHPQPVLELAGHKETNHKETNHKQSTVKQWNPHKCRFFEAQYL